MVGTNAKDDAKRIGRNITNLLIEHDKSQNDLAQALGVSKATVSSWVNGTRIPRMDKVNAMCEFFRCDRSAILENYSQTSAPTISPYADDEFRKKVLQVLNDEYYDDEVVRMMTDKLRTNPKYATLFRASANVKPEDIELVTKFIEKMSD